MRSLKTLILPAAAAAALCLSAAAALADSDGRDGKIFSPANGDQTAAAPVFSDVPAPAPRSFDARYPYKGQQPAQANDGWVDCQSAAGAGLDRCNGLK
jgi:hypothetical protein